MTFHLCGFSESQDSAVLVNAAALLDQAIQVNGDDIIVPNDLTLLLGAYALGPDITRAQVTSPSIRRIWGNEIRPVDVAALPADRLNVNWYGDSAIQLDPGEQLNGQMAESNAAASRVTILTWLADRVPQPAVGDIRSIRVTATTAAVANVWTNMNLTFNDVLPAGVYALVGADMQSTNLQAFRFVFKGGSYRPGWVGAATIGARNNGLQRGGRLGVWGEFEHLTPPSMDVLVNGTDAAYSGVMDLVYLGR